MISEPKYCVNVTKRLSLRKTFILKMHPVVCQNGKNVKQGFR